MKTALHVVLISVLCFFLNAEILSKDLEMKNESDMLTFTHSPDPPGHDKSLVTYPITAIAERSENRPAGSFSYSYDSRPWAVNHKLCIAAGYLVQVRLMSDEYGFEWVQNAVHSGAPIYRVSALPALTLLKNASKAGQKFGHDWMILGEMRPHPKYEVSECYELKKDRTQAYYNDDRVEYIYTESTLVKVPVVLCSAYISPDRTPAVVLINMSEKKQKVRIQTSTLGPEWNGRTTSMVLITNRGTTRLGLPKAEGELVLETPGLQTGILKPDN